MKIFLEITIALTIVDNPGLVSIILEASCAADLAPETAIPTSALASAGASLTPSPKIELVAGIANNLICDGVT